MPTSDIGHNMTEVELGKLQRRIENVYREASKEVAIDAKTYFEKFTKRDADMKMRVLNGTVSQQQYQEWRLAQIGRGKRLEELSDKLANRLTDADEVAIDLVNNAMPNIYALNRNYAAYTIERSGANVDFNLWDESTVRRLLKDAPDLMPNYPESRAINRGINLAYGKSQIRKTVTSGILQGWPIQRMAKNLTDNIVGMSKTSAIRAARTATTGAENAGRMDTLDAASQMGIKTEKEWMCTHDSRTRDSHANVDGTHVPINKKFANGVLYPGDPSGPASEIYNCRCTLVCWFPEIEEENNKRYTYKDWAAGKELVLTEIGPESTIGPKAIRSYLRDGRIATASVTNRQVILEKSEKYGIIGANGVMIEAGKNGERVYSYTTLGGAEGVFVNRSDNLYQYAQEVTPIEGFTDFVIHGDARSAFIENVVGTDDTIELTPKELAEMIRNSKKYKGGNIRLISCNTGSDENGFAQQLANELGVTVLAPTETVNVDEKGNIFLTDKEGLADAWLFAKEDEKIGFKETGKWIPFTNGDK